LRVWALKGQLKLQPQKESPAEAGQGLSWEVQMKLLQLTRKSRLFWGSTWVMLLSRPERTAHKAREPRLLPPPAAQMSWWQWLRTTG